MLGIFLTAIKPIEKSYSDIGKPLHEDLSLNVSNLNNLALDFKYYKVQNVDFHSGHLYEHSLWTALVVDRWFREKIDGATNKNDWENGQGWVEGIDESDRQIAVLAAFLHDVGKASNKDIHYELGYKDWFDTSFPRLKSYASYGPIGSHPEDGFKILTLKAEYLRSLVCTNEHSPFNSSSYQADFKKKGVFSFEVLFKKLGLTEDQKQIIQITEGCHWDFGIGVVANSDYQGFLTRLLRRARVVNYNDGKLDERIVRLASLIGAADVRGAQPENVTDEEFEEFKDRNPWFKSDFFEIPKSHNQCHANKFRDFYVPSSCHDPGGKGVFRKEQLLEYFKHSWKEVRLTSSFANLIWV